MVGWRGVQNMVGVEGGPEYGWGDGILWRRVRNMVEEGPEHKGGSVEGWGKRGVGEREEPAETGVVHSVVIVTSLLCVCFVSL